jgi:hypothetical protein
MRATPTFDTLEYMNELKRSGMKQEEAEAITNANTKAFNQMIDTKELSTKTDLMTLKSELQSFIVRCVTTTIVILGGLQTIFHFVK